MSSDGLRYEIELEGGEEHIGQILAIANEYGIVATDPELAKQHQPLTDENRLRLLVDWAEGICSALRGIKEEPLVVDSIVWEPLWDPDPEPLENHITWLLSLMVQHLEMLNPTGDDGDLTRARSATFVFWERTFHHAHMAAKDSLWKFIRRVLSVLCVDAEERQTLLSKDVGPFLAERIRTHLKSLKRMALECPSPSEWDALNSELVFETHKAEQACAGARGVEPQRALGGTPESQDDKSLIHHSLDFRSVHWFGTTYTFSSTQAACVKVLWQAWKNGTPELGQATILEHPEVEAESKRLVDVFKEHPAWKTMIVKGTTAGTYRLAGPSQES